MVCTGYHGRKMCFLRSVFMIRSSQRYPGVVTVVTYLLPRMLTRKSMVQEDGPRSQTAGVLDAPLWSLA